MNEKIEKLISQLEVECEKGEVPILLTIGLGEDDLFLALGTNGELCRLHVLNEMKLVKGFNLIDSDDIKYLALLQVSKEENDRGNENQ